MKYKNLNLKYALINAVYMFLVCSTVGYAANFLLSKGFSNATIGVTLSLVSVCGVLFQAVAAPFLDHSDRLDERSFIMMTLAVCVLLSILLFFLKDGAVSVLLVTGIAFVCASSIMPFINTIAFIYEKEGYTINYGVCRGIGSAAYALGSLLTGRFLNLQFSGGRQPAAYMPLVYAGLALLTIAAVAVLEMPSAETEEKQASRGISYPAFFRKYRKIIPVLAGMVCLFTCHMIINNFMIHVITNVGGTSAEQGTALFIQAMVELPPMFLFAKILEKAGVDRIMAIAAVCYSIKHLVVWLAPNMGMLYVSMTLQMLSYALLIPASVYFANKHIDEQDRNRGQALMTWTTTVGGIIASLAGGVLMDLTTVRNVLLTGFLISLAGTVLVVYGIRGMGKE